MIVSPPASPPVDDPAPHGDEEVRRKIDESGRLAQDHPEGATCSPSFVLWTKPTRGDRHVPCVDPCLSTHAVPCTHGCPPGHPDVVQPSDLFALEQPVEEVVVADDVGPSIEPRTTFLRDELRAGSTEALPVGRHPLPDPVVGSHEPARRRRVVKRCRRDRQTPRSGQFTGHREEVVGAHPDVCVEVRTGKEGCVVVPAVQRTRFRTVVQFDDVGPRSRPTCEIGRSIGASVRDHDDLRTVGERRQRAKKVLDSGGLVVCRDDDAELEPVRGTRVVHHAVVRITRRNGRDAAPDRFASSMNRATSSSAVEPDRGRPSRWRVVVALLPLVVLAAITLGPLPVGLLDLATDATHWTADHLGVSRANRPRRDRVEASLNVLFPAVAAILFLVAFPGVRARSVLTVGIAASLLIEGAQLVLPGRHADARDLILNSAGVLLGVTVVAAGRSVAGSTERRAGRG